MAIIPYQELLNDAMIQVLINALKIVQKDGISGDQSLYITFHTDHDGVILSNRVRSNYPKEITIVLQHQFYNLEVFNDYFSVNITFGGREEFAKVPYTSIMNFFDPSENFSIEFNHDSFEDDMDDSDLFDDDNDLINLQHGLDLLNMSSRANFNMSKYHLSDMQSSNFKIAGKNQGNHSEKSKKKQSSEKSGEVIDFNKFKKK